MGYSKHELSSINMLYSLKKIVIFHPYLLSSVPKVAIVERFDCDKKREGLPPKPPPPPPPYPDFFRVISGPGKFEFNCLFHLVPHLNRHPKLRSILGISV